MIGFFEYQYLKFKKNHLRNLVALAAADGHIHQDELDYLHKIGEKYQLKPQQIKAILQQQGEIEPEIPDPHHQRVALLYDFVGMMMADNVIEETEMEFCRKMFGKFGYKESLIDEMIALNRRGVDDSEEWELFLERADEFKLAKANW